MFQTVQEAVYPLNVQLHQPSQTISARVIIGLGITIMSKARFKHHLTGIDHLTIARRTIIPTPTANMLTIIPISKAKMLELKVKLIPIFRAIDPSALLIALRSPMNPEKTFWMPSIMTGSLIINPIS
jgi:hypothetical protein